MFQSSCISIWNRKHESKAPKPGQVAVMLNVYDMYWTNWYTAGAGLGVYHSGVEVHNFEWAYGGHPYAYTGVFEISPRDDRELGEQFSYKQSVHIGWTSFSEDEVRRLVSQLGKQFRGDRYHLMNNNCNHFANAFCQALCNRDIPAWVNRLAYVSSCVPFLQRCLPKEWLTPAALQQNLMQTQHSESTSDSQSVHHYDITQSMDELRSSDNKIDYKKSVQDFIDNKRSESNRCFQLDNLLENANSLPAEKRKSVESRKSVDKVEKKESAHRKKSLENAKSQ